MKEETIMKFTRQLKEQVDLLALQKGQDRLLSCYKRFLYQMKQFELKSRWYCISNSKFICYWLFLRFYAMH